MIMQKLTYLPLHGGRAPKWLFSRMVKLSGIIAEEIIDEFGADELVRRIADPKWFQALACAIGYDWHSSGTTTVTIAALKEALNFNSDIFIAGGKGSEGTSTPSQIAAGADYLSRPAVSDEFASKSRIIAKIDSALVYDRVSIYHHAFIFSKNARWCIVQQGMLGETEYAVRFQVLDSLLGKDITEETNGAVTGSAGFEAMDLTFSKNSITKLGSLRAVREDVDKLVGPGVPVLKFPKRHYIVPSDLSKRARELIRFANEMQPKDYVELLSMRGMGGRTLRSIAMISSLIYDTEIYKRDPVMYAYNLGGKDGIPYSISLKHYDDVINAMKEIVSRSRIDGRDKVRALSRLSANMSQAYSR